MARRMSCALTTQAVRAQIKTVTRRHIDTWKTLRAGDHLTLIEQGMGLKKGEKQVVMAEVKVVSVRDEPITLMSSDVRYGRQEMASEGFDPWDMDPHEWVEWWCRSHGERLLDIDGLPRRVMCRRIEWRYL